MVSNWNLSSKGVVGQRAFIIIKASGSTRMDWPQLLRELQHNVSVALFSCIFTELRLDRVGRADVFCLTMSANNVGGTLSIMS